MSLPNRADDAMDLPGSIRAVIDHPSGGRIVMAGFPGLETGVDGSAVFLPDVCRETLQGIKSFGATSLTMLIEADELDATFIPALKSVADAFEVAIHHFPIVDYSVPSDAQTTQWAQGAAERADGFARGETRAFACQYGAGRSGLMTARCLIEGGLSPDQAMAEVRAHFAEAIESDEQEAWLRHGA